MIARPRLCIVIPSLLPGGTERQALLLARGLTGDFSIDIVCTRHAGVWVDHARPHAEVFELGISSGWDYRLSGRLTKLFQERQPAIVQTYLSGFDWSAVVAARRAAARIVVSSRRELATWKKRRHVWLQRFANRRVQAIVANSRAVAEFAAEQEREPLESYTVIHNGVEAPAAQEGDSRLELTVPRGAPVVGMVANFSTDKDHALFVAMAQRVHARVPAAHFVLAGDGPLREATQRAVLRAGLGDAFRFAGTRKDARSLVAMFDVAVLTSKTEGFPNAVLEAMAAGRAVVAAAVGGVPEIIVDGESGRLVQSRDPKDFADVVVQLLNDPETRTRMGEQARHHVRECFSVETMVERHRKLYHHLLDEASRSTR